MNHSALTARRSEAGELKPMIEEVDR